MKNATVDRHEQRRVWVPFHFLPGGHGTALEEKLICQMDSDIAQEMMGNHIDVAITKQFGLELMGIAAHVYMDTFSHFGFSGLSSGYNSIKDESIAPLHVKNPEMERYVLDKLGTFLEKYGLNKAVSFFAEKMTDCLGHGAVATFPDRPFLEWEFEFDLPRPGNGTRSHRNNRDNFLFACRRLHEHFTAYAKTRYAEGTGVPFDSIEPLVRDILEFEGVMEDRSDKWRQSGLIDSGVEYRPELWEADKGNIADLASSDLILSKPVYRFHQAAAYHRYYVLKDLLPKHKIAVY